MVLPIMRFVPLGFWGVVLGAGAIAHGLISGPPVFVAAGAALVAAGAWGLVRWRRGRRRRR
ncbi:MAG TPA: hypothetical protein VHH36_08120 [Candidatus Thermoplasmatota archaeon]|nr:hypothetical protein [Candidatus Thermoplasmatota archaeon]